MHRGGGTHHAGPHIDHDKWEAEAEALNKVGRDANGRFVLEQRRD